MKLDLSITAAQVPSARTPIIGEEVQVYFAAENCEMLGSLRASGAAAAEYISAGGAGIPTAGRDVFVRISGSKVRGAGSNAMTVTFNVTLAGDISDTATATFHLPTWAPAGSKNHFPFGISADLVPDTPANAGLKIKALGALDSVANMTAGNKFEVYTSPNLEDFTFIDCCRGKGGRLNLPSIVEIACGTNPSAYTKLGRGESNPLSIEFINRGALEQLAMFNGHQGTIRFDIIKDESVLADRRLFTGFWVRTNGDIPDTGESTLTAEGPYTAFALGYPRVSA